MLLTLPKTTSSITIESYLLCRFWTAKKLSLLRKGVDRQNWLDNFLLNFVNLANAFYWNKSNTMVFPAGVLQDLFFDPGLPAFVNYGGIGAIIGHEISHGFDPSGRHTDENGQENRTVQRLWQVLSESENLQCSCYRVSQELVDKRHC